MIVDASLTLASHHIGGPFINVDLYQPNRNIYILRILDKMILLFVSLTKSIFIKIYSETPIFADKALIKLIFPKAFAE